MSLNHKKAKRIEVVTKEVTDSDDHMHVDIDIWDLDDTDALLMVKMRNMYKQYLIQ